MNGQAREELLDQVREQLRAKGIQLRTRSKRGERYWELGPSGDRFRVLLCDPMRVDSDGVPSTPGATIRVAAFINPSTARHWIAQGQAFADACGNANIEASGILVQVTARRPKGEARRMPIAQAPREWRGAALKVVFHLLVSPPLVQASIRDLAKRVGVSNGTVVGVLEDLKAEGHLTQTPSGKRHLLPSRQLEERWRYEYARRLRPKLLLGRYVSADPNWYRRFIPADHGAVWGGESAAEALGLDLRPGVRTVYTHEPLLGLAKALRLTPDASGTVEIRRWFWDSDLPLDAEGVPPHLLTIADLEATGDPRCIDAANELNTRSRGGL